MPRPTLRRERALHRTGFRAVAGADEAGRGALAGPLVAAAVILPLNFRARGLTDSKLLTAPERERHYARIVAGAVAWAIRVEPAKVIDRDGIQAVNLRALAGAIAALNVPADYALIDWFRLRLPIPSDGISHGDRLALSIAAASVVAKVTRDRLMRELHRQYPVYAFHLHKGYGTPLHIRRLVEHGPSPSHRRSFHWSAVEE